jgi:hypothetical protein
LIAIAYRFDSRLIQGGSAWLDDQPYDLDAKLPPGTPKIAFLLVERFKLAVYRETKEQRVYDIDLKWTPEDSNGTGPSLFTAIQEQLGLRLEPAPGVDGVTWKEYETGLEARIVDFPQPSPSWSVSGTTVTASLYSEGRWAAASVGCRGTGGQPGNHRRRLPALQNYRHNTSPPFLVAVRTACAHTWPIVQQAVVTILNEIYEVDFKGFWYGFRPGRNPGRTVFLNRLEFRVQPCDKPSRRPPWPTK